MSSLKEPTQKPQAPQFSSGPCRKFPRWNLADFDSSGLARSHRSSKGFESLKEVVELTREILAIPQGHQIAIVPGSATGAIEMAMWNFLGSRPLTCIVQDVFSWRWRYDIEDRLKLQNLQEIDVRENLFGDMPDLTAINPQSDVVLNWNGSTSGVRFQDLTFLDPNHEGLVIVDATSAVFTCKLPWQEMDVTAFSWQKGLGSEAAHGLIVLSPKAIQHLERYSPPWPIPYLFTLKIKDHFHEKLFSEHTLNTPSLLCVEDYRQALLWAQREGGLETLVAASQKNLQEVARALDPKGPFSFLASNPQGRSSSTLCLKVTHPEGILASWAFLKEMADCLAQREVAFDIMNHAGCAVPSLRLWGGPTMPCEDLRLLMPWLKWAYAHCYAKGLR